MMPTAAWPVEDDPYPGYECRDPDGAATEMIQNGTFTADALGASPDKWRLIGNHSGVVEDDPDNAGDHVLHVTAAGAQQHVHDHMETTFVGNTAVSNNTEYKISFRAKWLAGSSQLNNRFYFTRAGNTAHLDVPENHGTPGAQNLAFEANVGPAFSQFGHSPILPTSSEEVIVTVRAEDSHGVQGAKLFWNVNGGTYTQPP